MNSTLDFKINNMTQPTGGLFITKGMKVSVEKFSLKINEDGSIETNEMLFHTGLDMCPYWLNIAWSNLLKTEQYHNKIVQQANSGSESKLGDYLQKEFQIGMQTIMAACIAMDAYYASIKPHSDIPDDVVKKWRENKTARYKQISETLKNVFTIPQNTFLQIRESIKQGFDLRDRAVHPKSGTDLPVRHPEANVLSDWRFSTFRFANAKAILGNMLSIIYQTSRQKISKEKVSLSVTSEKHKNEIDPLINRWVKRYGKLF